MQRFGAFPGRKKGPVVIVVPPDEEPPPIPDVPTHAGLPSDTHKGNLETRTFGSTVTLNLQSGSGAAAYNQNILVQAAAVANRKHIIPEGEWWHSALVPFRGANSGLYGLGMEKSILRAQNPDSATFRIEANDVRFDSFTHFVSSTRLQRSSSGQAGHGNIFVNPNIYRFSAQDVKAWGSRDAAWHFYNCHDYRTNRCWSKNSGSDAQHNMQSASGWTHWDWTTEDCNDDMIGVVGYGTQCRNGRIVRATLKRQSHGRGIGLVHVDGITIVGPTLIEDTSAAGIIFAREPQYSGGNTNCPSTANVTIKGELRIRRANFNTENHGAITFANPTDAANHIYGISIEGPVIIEDTNYNRFTGAGAQVYAPSRTGRIFAEVRDPQFYSTVAKTKIPMFSGPDTIIRTRFPADYSPNPAPVYPLGSSTPPVIEEPPPSAATRYIAHTAAGTGDGSTVGNAAGGLSFISTFLNAGIKDIRVINSGIYEKASGTTYNINAGGTENELAVVRAVAPDGVTSAEITVNSTRPFPYNPAFSTSGGTAFNLNAGSDYIDWRGFKFTNVGSCFLFRAPNVGSIFRKTRFENIQRGWFTSAADAAAGAQVSYVTFEDTSALGYSKAVIRLAHQSHHITYRQTDPNNIGWLDGDFQDHDNFAVGIQLDEGVHDVVIDDPRIRNNIQTYDPAIPQSDVDDGDYWNGDGIVTEEGCYNILVRRPVIYGMTDGCLDIKGNGDDTVNNPAVEPSCNIVIEDGILYGSKRPLRLHDAPGVIVRRTRIYDPISRGGDGGAACVWLKYDSSLLLEDCDVSNQISGSTLFRTEAYDSGGVSYNNARIEVKDSRLKTIVGGAEVTHAGPSGTYVKTGTTTLTAVNGPAGDPNPTQNPVAIGTGAPPAAPVLSGSRNNLIVSLTFTVSSPNMPLSALWVEQQVGNSPWVKVALLTSATSYQHTITEGPTYKYRIVAKNAAGTSLPSNVLSYSVAQPVDEPMLVTAYSNAIIADNPVVYYRLDAATGAYVDGSGNNRHATVVDLNNILTRAAPGLLVTEPASEALKATGNGASIEGPLLSTGSLGSAFTLECWAKVESAASNHQYVIMLSTPNGQALGLAVRRNATNNRLALWDSVNSWRESLVSLALNTTYHLVAVVNGLDVSFYVNGVFLNTVTAVNTPNGAYSRIYVASNGVIEAVRGITDEVAVYSGALSPARIAAHYDLGT